MNGSGITVRWNGGERRFDAGSDVVIGRDPQCDVVIENANVSRRHAILTQSDGRWRLADSGSSQGTHVAGAPVAEVTLDGSTEVVLGRPGRGEVVTITVGADSTAGEASSSDLTTTADERPGGGLREDAVVTGTVVTGEVIRVECSGRSYEFAAGSAPTIGRDPVSDIVSTNPTVSRRHARLIHSEGWLLEDLGSSGGVFVDGRRVPSVKLAGTVTVFLGDPEAGERLVFVASGKSKRRRSSPRMGAKGRVLVAMVSVLALLVAGVALIQTRGSDSSPTNDRLAQATVQLVHDNTDGGGVSVGSGTVIDARQGLILTNAHAVAPAAPGTGVRDGLPELALAPNPARIEVWVSAGLDRAAEPTYRGRVVAVDGYLDLAVVQITEFISGELIEAGDLDGLVQIAIGSSDDVRSGDSIRVLGYPVVAQSGAPQVTTGVVAGPIRDNRLATNRALFNIDAEISGGNSGGAAVDDAGRLIGVPTSVLSEDDTGGRLGHVRPIDLALDLIEAARSGEPYDSPYITALTGDEELEDVTAVRPGGVEGFSSSGGRAPQNPRPGQSSVAFEIRYQGFGVADHQDVLVTLYDEGRNLLVAVAETDTQYPFALESDGMFVVTLALPGSGGLLAGEYLLEVFVGPNYSLIGRRSLSV